MKLTFQWLLRLLITLITIALLSIFLMYYFSLRSIPNYNKEYEVNNIIKDIEIVRDSKGVPHIFPNSDNDAYFGLGFVHAQDRLWQMTLMRRAAQGRLSEIFGKETIKSDEYIRRLDIYNISKNSVIHQSPKAIDALNSYSEGVNAWLKILQSQALGRGAPEFFLFKPEISPWVPADSLAILKLMAVRSSYHLKSDILRARTSLTIGNDRMMDILPDDPTQGSILTPDYSDLFQIPKNSISELTRLHELNSLGKPSSIPASNIWAAHSKRTSAKASLLAADPHNSLSAPSYWMLARLELSSGGVIGASIPGLPLIISGRSKDLAWGFSASNADDSDIYIEQLNPNNKDEYRVENTFVPFKTKKVLLKIKDAPSKTLELQWTRNGVVLPGSAFGLNQITPRDHIASIKFTATNKNDKSFSALLNLMSENSVTSAQSQFINYIAPVYNMVIADSKNIALQIIGRLPHRKKSHLGEGRIPAQGWLNSNQWQGFFSYDKNPSTYNPISGIVANTNNKTTNKPFPNHIAHRWSDNFRIKRLSQLMSSRQIHTRDSFMEAQLDTVSIAARTVLPLIAKELWFTETYVDNNDQNDLRKKALQLLANWNGDMNEHQPEPLIYASWIRNFQNFLIRDELGPLSQEFLEINPIFLERVMKNINGASIWCNIKASTTIETCTDIAIQSLDAALLELSIKYGKNLKNWQWGEAHIATHKHLVFGSIPLVNWISNIKQRTSGGDNTLMRAKNQNFGDEPYANINAAGFRMLIDFSDLESSLYIISTGQSGHPLSRHYDDLAQLWRRGEYIPMVLDPKLARAGSIGVLNIKQMKN